MCRIIIVDYKDKEEVDLVKMIYEDDEIAEMREKIKKMNNNQLSFLEQIIKREMRDRQKRNFTEWLDIRDQFLTDNENTGK